MLHTLRDENTDSKRPRPSDKRVWASVEKQPRAVIRQAFEEALRQDPERRLRWVVLVDGEPRQLKAVKAEAKRAGVAVTLILDVVHVLEYLWLAGRALFGGSTPEAETWVGHRLLGLLTGRSGGDIAGTIRWWARSREAQLDAAGRKAIKKACGYLANRTRTRLMRYADALRDGLPNATGVIEGACRYLVKDRWIELVRVGLSKAQRPYSDCARCAHPVTSTTTGTSTLLARRRATMHSAMRAANCLTRCPRAGATCAASSDRDLYEFSSSKKSRTQSL